MPSTDEVRALDSANRAALERKIKEDREQLQWELRTATAKIGESATRIEQRLENTVDEKLCKARVGEITASMRAMGTEFSSAICSLTREFQGFREDMSVLVNGKMAQHKDAIVDEVTDRLKPSHILASRKKTTQETKPLLSRMGENAKSLTAIISLTIMLLGGCVASAYYVTGLANAIKNGMAEQKQLMRQQETIVKAARRDNTPIIHYFAAPTDAGIDEPAKPASRRRHRQ